MPVKAVPKNGKLAEIEGGRKSVKAALQHLVDHVDEDYPHADEILVIFKSRPIPDDRDHCKYGIESTEATDANRLWLIEIAKDIILRGN